MNHICHHGNRRQFVRSAVAGSLLMPGLLSELLAADGGDRSPTWRGQSGRSQAAAFSGQGQESSSFCS